MNEQDNIHPLEMKALANCLRKLSELSGEGKLAQMSMCETMYKVFHGHVALPLADEPRAIVWVHKDWLAEQGNSLGVEE
jgi:hypothetical protein